LTASYSGRGSDPFPPLPLLAVAVYDVHLGHHSPADWHRHAKESLPVRWLLRGLAPSRSAWYAFRHRLSAPLLDLVHQTVRAALAEGLTSASRAALDGTLLAADSSRHHLLNQDALERRGARLDDADGLNGPPAPLRRGVGRTAAGRDRQRRLYFKLSQELGRRIAHNRNKRASKRKPDEDVRISPADPEAALGRDKEKVYRPLYNVQVLADVDTPLVLTYQVAAQANDAGLLGGVLKQAREGLGQGLSEVLADAGYAGGADLAAAEAEKVMVYAPWQSNDYSKPGKAKFYPKEKFTYLASEGAYECPAGQRLRQAGKSRTQRSGTGRVELTTYQAVAETCAACEQRSACTTAKKGRTISRGEDEGAIERLRERMATAEGRAKYRLRKEVAERLFADFKGHRGLRRVTGRGLKRVSACVGLTALGHNLIAMHSLRKNHSQPANAITLPP
jgi:hypothetical protein